MMERLKPYFEEVLAPKTEEDRERREFFAQLMEKARKRWKEEERALKEPRKQKSLRQFSLSVKPFRTCFESIRRSERKI